MWGGGGRLPQGKAVPGDDVAFGESPLGTKSLGGTRSMKLPSPSRRSEVTRVIDFGPMSDVAAPRPRGRARMSVAGISLDRVKCDAQQRTLSFMDCRLVSALFMLLTFVTLFADDARLAAAPKSADDAFAFTFVVAFVLFALDWGISTS